MGENLIDISVLMTFNKLKNIIKKGGLTTDEGLALVSHVLEVARRCRFMCYACYGCRWVRDRSCG